MSDLNIKSDSVDVEQIMKQIRSRIREKRGSDYTEAELQQLASAKFEQFADPSGLRSDLLEQFRKRGDEPSTYHRHRGVRRVLLMMAHPLLKRVQKQLMSDLNLYFEIIHNLVIEVTKLGIENHNLKMKVESLSSRLDFDERRGRALEGAVQYRQPRQHQQHQDRQPQHQQRPAQPQPMPPPPQAQAQAQTTAGAETVQAVSAPPIAQVQGGQPSGQPGQEGGPRGDGSGRRRRRRRRRRPGSSLAESPNAQAGQSAGAHQSDDQGDDGDDGAADQ